MIIFTIFTPCLSTKTVWANETEPVVAPVAVSSAELPGVPAEESTPVVEKEEPIPSKKSKVEKEKKMSDEEIEYNLIRPKEGEPPYKAARVCLYLVYC